MRRHDGENQHHLLLQVKADMFAGPDTDWGGPDQGLRNSEYGRPPDAIDLQASDGTYASFVRLTWTEPPGTYEYKYSIWRKFVVDDRWSYFARLIDDLVSGNTYDGYTAEPGGVRTYGVETRYLCGGSAWNLTTDSGYLRVPIPPAPGNVQASICTYPDKVRIEWDAVAGATNYLVTRARPALPVGSKDTVYEGRETSYDDTGVEPGQIYYY